MAFEAKWFWKALWPGKKDPEPKQHGQEQLRSPLTPEKAYRKRKAMWEKRKAQKSTRRRNRK